MLTKTFFALATAALAAANPAGIRRQYDGPGCGGPTPTPVDGPAPTPETVPVLPVNGGPTELAAPPPNTTLKYIALGHGIQNYTCANTSATAVAAGALAVFYDITSLYPGQSEDSVDQTTFDTLPALVLGTRSVPLNSNPSGGLGADPTNPFPAPAPLQLAGFDKPIPFLGHHFFTGPTPRFVLDGDNGPVDFFAARLNGIPAPANAFKGPENTGAVAWLQLGAVEPTTGAQFVYRVVTAGGNSHGCASGNAQDSVSYTSQYWFFG